MNNQGEKSGAGGRFRNHISIIAEQTGGVILAFLILAVTQVFQNMEEIAAADMSFLTDRGAVIALAVFLLFLISIASQFLIWAKTYISIQEHAIVIERDTLNKKKSTIGMRNISNINIEQNLFEMLMGTCKVKLDTNSRSTADRTDVKIVLKKKEAEWFKREVALRMRAAAEENSGAAFPREISDGKTREWKSCAETREESPGTAGDAEEFDIRSDLADILRHGFFSINIFSVVLLVIGIAGAVFTAMEILEQPVLMRSAASVGAAVLVAVSVILSALWDTVKDFVKYYDFRAKRRGNRIYIKYGFLKKVEYTVPVDKIQALKVRQSLVARLGGRYMAEIVNVGMGDEQNEQNSFLILYGSEKKLKERLSILLPEFLPATEQKTERLPAAAWAAWLLPSAVYISCAAAGAAVLSAYLREYRSQIWLCVLGTAVFMLLGMALKYRTDGVAADENYLKVCRGYFGRNYLAVRCRNIQYVEFSQNFLAKHFKIRKGKLHLLASSANTTHDIPYFRGNIEEEIKRGMLAF